MVVFPLTKWKFVPRLSNKNVGELSKKKIENNDASFLQVVFDLFLRSDFAFSFQKKKIKKYKKNLKRKNNDDDKKITVVKN